MKPDSSITPRVNLRRDAARLFLALPREKRHLTGFLLAALALIFLVVAPAYNNYRGSYIRAHLDERVEPLNVAAKKIQELVLEERLAVGDLLSAGDEAVEAERLAVRRGQDGEVFRNFELSQFAKYQAGEQELEETIEASRPVARSLGKETAELFEQAVKLSIEYRKYLRLYLILYQAGRTEDARLALANGKSLETFSQFARTDDALVLYTDNMRADLQQQLAELNLHSFYLSIPLALIGLILLFYILLLLTNSILLLRETRAQNLEIEQQREQLEKANHIKDEFLSILSHELRTPLTPILGWTAILKRKMVKGSDIAQAVEVIERSAKIQSQIINDLLDLSHINNQKLKIEKITFDLNDCVSAAISTVRPTAEVKGIKIHENLGQEQIFINADPLRIQQVIWNLLSNAIKYNYRGGEVFLSLRLDAGQAVISVRDTGVGIKPEILTDIFGKFQQADSSITRQHGGLGIGLSIVKSLVESHQGTVIAQSEGEGKGSTFTIKIPLAHAKARAKAHAA